MKTMRKFPVMLTFDIDAETLWTARDPKMENYPVALSQGVYGTKIGVDRILKLLSRYGIAATFFCSGKDHRAKSKPHQKGYRPRPRDFSPQLFAQMVGNFVHR